MTLKQIYLSKIYDYSKERKEYLINHKNQKITNPLLISDSCLRKFLSGDIRVMIFGQETNSWYTEKELDVETLQEAYDEFYTSGFCYSYGGQFWNGVNRLKTFLEKEFPEKDIQFMWNNIIKVGKQGKGRPDDSVLEIEKKYLNVIPNEIKIAKPNVIVFFTGPNYDDILSTVFTIQNKQIINKFTERQLSKMIISDHYLAYRTYHPNYLWRNDINTYLKTIVSDIKRNIILKST